MDWNRIRDCPKEELFDIMVNGKRLGDSTKEDLRKAARKAIAEGVRLEQEGARLAKVAAMMKPSTAA